MEEPRRKHIAAQTVACLVHQGSYDSIGSVNGKLFGWAGSQRVRPAGQPFTVFLEAADEMNWAQARFEVCLPVPAGTAGSGGVTVKTLPAAEVACVVVQGPYSEVPAHYTELLSWLDYEGLTVAGPPREVYLVHPGPDGTGDPKSFRTEIQFPIHAEE
jgi:effector-binding domain-containing protein